LRAIFVRGRFTWNLLCLHWFVCIWFSITLQVGKCFLIFVCAIFTYVFSMRSCTLCPQQLPASLAAPLVYSLACLKISFLHCSQTACLAIPVSALALKVLFTVRIFFVSAWNLVLKSASNWTNWQLLSGWYNAENWKTIIVFWIILLWIIIVLRIPLLTYRLVLLILILNTGPPLSIIYLLTEYACYKYYE
jgi:hypothetical protein